METKEDLPLTNEVDFAVTVHDDEILSNAAPSPQSSPSSPAVEANRNRQLRKRSRGKRAHVARVAAVVDIAKKIKTGLTLPSNQYEVTLIRRAVRKADLPVPSDNYEYGDTSLGMKLSVVEGKVIVQSLNPLADGKASPAQLVGFIKRGDVLLTVNGVSLVNLPIDQLMGGLDPLSSPDASGLYQRRLDLRLESGAGLMLLERSESGIKSQSAASDMLSLFPLVDQLSGLPLFDGDRRASRRELEKPEIRPPVLPPVPPVKTEVTISFRPVSPRKEGGAPNERVSLVLAALKQKEREQSISAFFAWNKKHSRLLRMDDSASIQSLQALDNGMTKDQLLEQGQIAMLGATALTKQMEAIDSGKDVRSFRSWKTTLSLNSRSRTRRLYFLESASLPIQFQAGRIEEEKEETSSDGPSNGSGASVTSSQAGDDENNLDGDELLLRLAAHDEIWRKQVVEFLNESAGKLLLDGDYEVADPAQPEVVKEGLPMTDEFSNFLFGESLSKILNKQKKTRALPPEEVTSVLFDLTTRLSSSIPNEIASHNLRSTLDPFKPSKHAAPETQVVLATSFLIEEALPAWVMTFRPLPWDQRRILWPVQRQLYGGSSAGSSLSDDLYTLDTLSTGLNSLSSKHRKKKDLQELVEEQELNPETREETCFLMTYFFTESLLPRIHDKGTSNDVLEPVRRFVKEYGAYLRLSTCLVYAGRMKEESIMEMLLELAQYDPRHREIMKLTAKPGSLVLYDPTMLSAILQRLYMLPTERSIELSQATIDRCASAYPDVQPWLVRKQCLPEGTEGTSNLADLYYAYLTLLLHPTDGHSTARRDLDLVKDWCNLSIKKLNRERDNPAKCQEYRANLLTVASRSSNYGRDLVHLLQLVMDIKEYYKALDLAHEILDDPDLSKDQAALDAVIENVRTIGEGAALGVIEPAAAQHLRSIIKLFQKAKQSHSEVVHKTFNIPLELLRFIQISLPSSGQGGLIMASDLSLINFFANEASPVDLLQSLACIQVMNGFQPEVLPVIRTLLTKAARESVSSELSVSLMKVRLARMEIEQVDNSKSMFEESEGIYCQAIWQRMSDGTIAIAK